VNPLTGLLLLGAVYRVVTSRMLVAQVCNGDVYTRERRAQLDDGVPSLRSLARLVPDEDGVLRLVLA